jgi:hypothetical protein
MREGLEGETYAGRYVVADARLASPVAAGEGTVVVRAGFARLSAWQPVGNWVASAGNFPASCYPWASPDNEQKNRDAQFAARSPSRAGGQCTRLQLTGRAKPSPATG